MKQAYHRILTKMWWWWWWCGSRSDTRGETTHSDSHVCGFDHSTGRPVVHATRVDDVCVSKRRSRIGKSARFACVGVWQTVSSCSDEALTSLASVRWCCPKETIERWSICQNEALRNGQESQDGGTVHLPLFVSSSKMLRGPRRSHTAGVGEAAIVSVTARAVVVANIFRC